MSNPEAQPLELSQEVRDRIQTFYEMFISEFADNAFPNTIAKEFFGEEMFAAILKSDPLALEFLMCYCTAEIVGDESPRALLSYAQACIEKRGLSWGEITPEERKAVFSMATDSLYMAPCYARHQSARAAAKKAKERWQQANNIFPEQPAKAPTETSADFFIHTSQEIDVLSRAQCDGKSFSGYLLNAQAGAITYERKGLSHRIQLALTSEEQDAGLALAYLEKMVRAQDSDAVLAALYIMGVLAPPSPLPPREYAGGWIDFNDVIAKIGWYPQTTKERREMHARIWEYIRYGERAQIIGRRTIKYKDKATGEEIDTEIHGAAWRVMKTEMPQPSLYPARDIPVRAEIVMSQELTALITAPGTAQYLPMAEVLGAIPGGKPSGAWARVIGLSLASVWRRKPRETTSGTLKPMRRELLSHYAAKIAPYQEVLASKDPQRAIRNWCNALQILADGGFIERDGEASIRPEVMRANLPQQNWRDVWLDETVNIKQGATVMAPALKERAEALPTLKPRDLQKKPRAKKQLKSR